MPSRRCIYCLKEAIPGGSRCVDHGGRTNWRKYPRRAEYDSPEYEKHRKAILEGGPVCHWCRREPATTADHVIPLSRGGTNDLGNLVPACRRCNTLRGGAEGRRTQKARAARDSLSPGGA